MNQRGPRVSIGLPVYNGEQFVAAALDALLAQTFRDFELIISDNGSTDRTEEICRSYAAKDPRVHYYRNAKNLGAAGNHNRVVALSTGELFMWFSHDDLCSPEYMQRCVEFLDQHPDYVLSYSRTGDIDAQGNTLPRNNPHRRRAVSSEDLDTSAEKPSRRFRELIRMEHQCEAIYAVMRADILKKTPLHGHYADADRVVLAELGLYGRFHVIPQTLFFHREHPARSVHTNPGRQERTVWMDPTKAGKIVLPHFRQFSELLAVVRRTPLPLRERLSCCRLMLRWLWVNRRRLFSDLEYSVLGLARKVLRRSDRATDS